MAKSTKNKKSVQKLVPLRDEVLIKLADQSEGETTLASGIIIPAGTQEDKLDRGKVVAVGEGRTTNDGNVIPMTVKVGDTVLFQWGEKFSIDDEEFHIVSESNIKLIVK